MARSSRSPIAAPIPVGANKSVGHAEEPKMDGVMTEAHGRRLGERLHVENARAIVARALQGLAVKLGSAVAIMMLVLTPAHAVEPFGVATTPSQSDGLITLWRDLQTELAKDEV